MANSLPNKARAIEGAVTSTLILLVPFAQTYLDRTPRGRTIEMIISALVVAAVSFVKSLQAPPASTAEVLREIFHAPASLPKENV